MFKFAPYVLKSLLRHRTRTLLTVSGSAVALFVFAFIGAAQQGLIDMTRGKQAERTLIVFQANRFCPSTSRLPEDYAASIRKLEGVKDVTPIYVYMNNCRASLDLVLFHGVPAEKLGTARNLRFIAGDRSPFDRDKDAALVGHVLASRRGLSPGQKFTIGEISVTVAGIFKAETPAEENLLYCHLDYLQRARGNSLGVVTEFEVQLDEAADPDAICRRIDDLFRTDRVATETRPRGIFQASVVGDLAELIGWANYLGYACLGLVLALVAATTVMSIQDRVREHAVLQAIGYSSPHVFCLVLSEGMIVSLIGGIVGVTIALAPSFILAIHGLVASLFVGLLASVLPAWRAATAEVVVALRAN